VTELEVRLSRFRQIADATVFAGVEVTADLKARVLRAVLEDPERGPVSTVPPLQATIRRARLRSNVVRLLGAATLVVLATLAAFALWPTGHRAAASLSVAPAGSAFVAVVPDPYGRASRGEIVPLRDQADTELLPVEIDAAGSLSYRWSADGRRLAFGNRGDLFVYDTKTGETTNLTRTPKRWELLPSWSPDGTRLAFTSRRLEPGEGPPADAPNDPDWVMVGVHGGSPAVVGVDGSGYRVLDDVTVTSAPSWSSDGSTLAYATDGVVEADVPETRFARADGVIHLADVTSGRVRTIEPLLGRGARYVGAPSWSPTRSELAVFFSESDRFPAREEILSNTARSVRQGYALLDLENGAVSVVHSYRAPFVPRGPAAWSDDGDLLALLFRQETAVADPVELDVVTRNGDLELRLPGLFSNVAWEPGEHRLAARRDDDPAEATLVTLDGKGEATQTLRFAKEVRGIAWRPEG
jgi:dipeptidyl aminopeptidase/acylaminoacyl peptidase